MDVLFGLMDVGYGFTDKLALIDRGYCFEANENSCNSCQTIGHKKTAKYNYLTALHCAENCFYRFGITKT